MKKFCGVVSLLTLWLVAIDLWASQQAQAAPSVATFPVNSTLDEPDANVGDGQCISAPSGKCTLRAAVMQANVINVDTTILVPAGIYTLTIPPIGSDGPETGDLNLTGPTGGNPVISIVGAGANSTIVEGKQNDGSMNDRILSVSANRRASISGLTMRHGSVLPSGAGGGILNAGTLTLTQVSLTANHSRTGGGAFNEAGVVLLIQTTVDGNQAGYGGGLYNDDGALSVLQSTFSGNGAAYGGGILNYGTQTAMVVQSTIRSNTAITDGAGIYNSGYLSLINSTISSNSANNNGGGIWNEQVINSYSSSIVNNLADADHDVDGGNGGGLWNSGTFNLRHTLVAANTSTNSFDGYDDCTGTINAYGWNLFWTVSGFCTLNTYNSTWGYLSSLVDLGPLQNNGGPTLTHALQAGSNAIDGSSPAAYCTDAGSPLVTDQRGAARAVDGDHDGFTYCDIGAFEYRPPLLLPLIRR